MRPSLWAWVRQATASRALFTRIEGTGLGMSIVKSLIDRMGGRIEVESQEGAGSRFRVQLATESSSCSLPLSVSFARVSSSLLLNSGQGTKALMPARVARYSNCAQSASDMSRMGKSGPATGPWPWKSSRPPRRAIMT